MKNNKPPKYNPPSHTLLTVNKNPASAGFREIVQSREFKDNPSPLTVVLGRNDAGREVVTGLDKMPHLLIAGASGTGKSVCLSAIILSLLFKSSPTDVRLILAAPKSEEFSVFEGLPHLLGGEVLSSESQVLNAFEYLTAEAERREGIFSAKKAKTLSDYNKSATVKSGYDARLPYIVFILDEFSELGQKEIESRLGPLCEKAAAVGIHLVLTTQKTTVEVVSGTVKAAVPGRIAFWVSDAADSRTVLDCTGAETLSGVGHMLYMSHEMNEPRNVKAVFVTNEDITAVTGFVKSRNTFDTSGEFSSLVKASAEDSGSDPLLLEILSFIIGYDSISTGILQRQFALGYSRANQLIDLMEAKGYIGSAAEGNIHTVYLTAEQLALQFGIEKGTEEAAPEPEDILSDTKKNEKPASKKLAAKLAEETVSSGIKVIGIGMGGINSVNRLMTAGLKAEQVVAIDADAVALGRCEAKFKINIGGKASRTAWAENSDFDKTAAAEHRKSITDALSGTDIVFLTVGAGVGVGTGAAGVVAEIAREMGIVSIAFVTKPFLFEGKAKIDAANAGIADLAGTVDILTEISSEKLMEMGGDLPIGEAYRFADDALRAAFNGIGELFVSRAWIGLDFKDVIGVLRGAGSAHFGVGSGKGDDRVGTAVTAAAENLILGTRAAGAKNVIMNIIGSKDLSLREINEAAKQIGELAGEDAIVSLGADIRENHPGGITVTVIASGIKKCYQEEKGELNHGTEN